MTKAGERIIKGLRAAVAYAKGDKSKGTLYTVTVAREQPALTLESVKEWIDKISLEPRLIGNIGGISVWVDPSVPDNQMQFRLGSQTLAVSIDHPYLEGTKVQMAAKKALGI